MQQNSRQLQILTREEMFMKRRNGSEQLAYLQYYDQQTRQQILQSLTGDIPIPLPTLSVQTISYYRRSGQAVYKTTVLQSIHDCIDPHMLYESLWMLASLEEKEYQHYTEVVMEFERNLHKYLASEWEDIKELAAIVAGDKIIGLQADILMMVRNDPKQMWVLLNHISEGKIALRELLPLITSNDEMIFRTLYEITNENDDESIQLIVNNDSLLNRLVQALNDALEICMYIIRILGNIIADREEYGLLLQKYGLVDRLFGLIVNKDAEVRRDVCWLLSNYACQKGPATHLQRHAKMMTRLLQLLQNEQHRIVQYELAQLFYNIIAHADRLQVYQQFASEQILSSLYNYLTLQDVQLTQLVLHCLLGLLELGKHFMQDEHEENLFVKILLQCPGFVLRIRTDTFSQNHLVSKLSLKLLEELGVDDIC